MSSVYSKSNGKASVSYAKKHVNLTSNINQAVYFLYNALIEADLWYFV